MSHRPSQALDEGIDYAARHNPVSVTSKTTNDLQDGLADGIQSDRQRVLPDFVSYDFHKPRRIRVGFTDQHRYRFLQELDILVATGGIEYRRTAEVNQVKVNQAKVNQILGAILQAKAIANPGDIGYSNWSARRVKHVCQAFKRGGWLLPQHFGDQEAPYVHGTAALDMRMVFKDPQYLTLGGWTVTHGSALNSTPEASTTPIALPSTTSPYAQERTAQSHLSSFI